MNKLFLLLLLVPSICLAEDGNVGATSTGSCTITIVIPPRIVMNPQNPTVPTSKGTNVEYTSQTTYTANGIKVIIYMPKTN